MTSKASINDFIAQKTLAVVGVSRDGKKFSNMAYRELKAKGYRLFPVNSTADSVEGEKCYPNLGALPEKVDGVIIFVQPDKTEQVVREAAAAGIKRVWMQQGAESAAAIRLCQENGISAVHGECIMMFAEPAAWFHRMHRWVWGVLGKLPQ
jgi:hypothetical protein